MSATSRRDFLKRSAALGVGLSAGLVGRAHAANNKISVACIGVRGRGNSVMQSFAAEPDCEITHICDVRESVRQQRGAEMKEKTGRMPKLVNDYRTLLDDKSVDVFMVATPDHWHALLTIEGCLADKDVYVEKPASPQHTRRQNGGRRGPQARSHGAGGYPDSQCVVFCAKRSSTSPAARWAR